MFFNVSNHPAHSEKTTWTETQIEAANAWAGEIVDIGFPTCTPEMEDEEIANIAHAAALDIFGMANHDGRPAVAMVAGHYIMATYLVAELQSMDIKCCVGDSTRIAEEQIQHDGTIAIVHRFQFAGFRLYPNIILA